MHADAYISFFSQNLLRTKVFSFDLVYFILCLNPVSAYLVYNGYILLFWSVLQS